MLIYLLISLAFLLYLLFSVQRPSNFPPGPPWLPIVGNTLLLKKLSKKYGSQFKAFLKLSEQYNSDIVGLKLGNERYVVVFGRKLNQQVFTKPEFQGRPDGFFIRLRTLGTRRGITMTDGVTWHQQRSFADKNLKQLGLNKGALSKMIKNELESLLDQLSNQKDDFYMNNYVSPSFLNILWTIVGGPEYLKNNSILPQVLDLLKERSKAFDMAGGILNQLPWIRFIAPDYSGYRLIVNLNRKLFALIQEIIIDHKRTLTEDTRDFIDAYLHEMSLKRSENNTFSDEQLIATCLDFFIAGSLTTSNTLDLSILTVLLHPDVKKKVHQSLDDVLAPTSLPSLEDKEKLPYIEAVLLECQRLQHVAPTAGPRRTLEDSTLDGYHIPKNTIVLMSLRSIHYDETRWKDPHLFKPERFLDSDGNVTIDEGLCLFGLGKRRCPGEMLAKNYLFLAFTTLFHRYDISLSPGQEDLRTNRTQAGILLTAKPYKVCLRQRHPIDTDKNSLMTDSTISGASSLSNGHLAASSA